MTPKKVVVISGGTKGLGLELSLLFASEGYAVVSLFSNDLTAADSLQTRLKRISESFLVLKCDVSDATAVHNAFGEIRKVFGRVDVLINNASKSFTPTPMQRLQWQDFEDMWSVGVKGSFLCFQEAFSFMKGQKSGTVINILTSALQPLPPTGFSAYLTAKSALLGMSRSLSAEYKKYGLRVANLFPSIMETEMTRSWHPMLVDQIKSSSPQNNFTSLGAVAKRCLDICSETEPSRHMDHYFE